MLESKALRVRLYTSVAPAHVTVRREVWPRSTKGPAEIKLTTFPCSSTELVPGNKQKHCV